MLDRGDIGLQRRGEEEFAVADLKVLIHSDNDSVPVKVERFRYRSNAGSRRWEVKRILIRRREGTGHGLPWWTTDKVFSFEGYLCWIDYFRGILFCDVIDEYPELRYVELPVAPPEGNSDHPNFGRPDPFVTRSVCVMDGSTMRFVNVARADGEIASKRNPGSRFTMTTWSLVTPLNSERIGWAMDGAVESARLWTHDSYAELRLPLLMPEFPFVSLREPDVIYAVPRERHCGDRKTWVLVIDMRRKALRSAVPYNEVEDFCGDGDEDERWPRVTSTITNPFFPACSPCS
ncbi:hypothetical protein BAE44_0010934 [Dichanthelium oligosanthes]|uniref:DUF1618 domain-containing protein n=1 Tax=Dichanthelium oligosanthes TaxID=888268 RepID=A0A1E5VSE1_9POAL|nr:hypothetical protein BAE44_0010934 [Dichanthelium oligosanthes]